MMNSIPFDAIRNGNIKEAKKNTSDESLSFPTARIIIPESIKMVIVINNPILIRFSNFFIGPEFFDC